MAPTRLDWRGDQVLKAARDGSRDGVEETVDRAVQAARAAAPVETGELRSNIVRVSVDVRGDGVRARWGGLAPHTIFQEIGFHGRAGRHFLRQGADAEYGQLAGRIAQGFQRRAPR